MSWGLTEADIGGDVVIERSQNIGMPTDVESLLAQNPDVSLVGRKEGGRRSETVKSNPLGKKENSSQRKPVTLHGEIKQYNRQAAGKQAKRSGDAFEAQLDAYHGLLIETGEVVYIRRQMPPMRSVYRGGQTVFVPTGPGPCDYIYVLPDGAVGIFDAKSTGNKSQFSWPKAQRHQLEEMRSFVVGASFALVEWRAWGEARVHDYYFLGDGIVRRDEGILLDGIEWLKAL